MTQHDAQRKSTDILLSACKAAGLTVKRHGPLNCVLFSYTKFLLEQSFALINIYRLKVQMRTHSCKASLMLAVFNQNVIMPTYFG
jgi:hypothetical protein